MEDVVIATYDCGSTNEISPILHKSTSTHHQRFYHEAMATKCRRFDKVKGFLVEESEKVNAEFFREQEIKQGGKCIYCHTVMLKGEGIDRRKNLQAITAERKDNNLPHTKSNTVLACVLCNKKTASGNIPHALMLKHGPEFHANKLRMCIGRNHKGEQPVPVSEFGGPRMSLCTKCGTAQSREARTNTFGWVVMNAKNTDRKSGRTIVLDQYIDEEFVKAQYMLQTLKCYFCKDVLEIPEKREKPEDADIVAYRRRSDLCTKDNCVLACKRCSEIGCFRGIPFDVMEQYVHQFKEGSIWYCRKQQHTGNRILNSAFDVDNRNRCKECRKIETKIYDETKKAKKQKTLLAAKIYESS